MKATFKAELLKFLTARSTYFAMFFVFALTIFLGLYAEGMKGIGGELSSMKLTELAQNSGSLAAQVGGIIAALMMIHEYRYNVITYTLTISNSRLKVLLAKAVTTLGYIILFSITTVVIGLLSYKAGLAIRGAELVPQTFDVVDVLARTTFYSAGYALAALMLAALLRNIAVTIAVLFIAPSIELLLQFLIFKNSDVYLPFTALGSVLYQGPNIQDGASAATQEFLEPGKAALIFTVYLIVGWIITSVLFVRRDAN